MTRMNISKKISLAFITLLLFFMVAANPVQAQSRNDMPNDFGIELLGKAVVYSFSYQRMVTSSLGLEAGLSALSTLDATVFFFPLGARYYFIEKNASPFVTGGIVILTGSADSGPIESASYGYAGPGFEFRSDGGFLFRGSLYVLFAGGEIFIWPGLHVGYAF